MIQPDLFIILENRTKYLIEYNKKISEAWFMGGLFNFNVGAKYHQAIPEKVKVIARIGTPREIFK